MNSDKILQEAKDRFKRCQAWESSTRVNFLADVKFGNGDSINNFQWQSGNLRDRQLANKPAATINRVQQYCLQIINDSRQNKPDIEVRAVGGGASFRSAEIMEGIIRHICYISNAQQAFDSAVWSQVFGGIGYFRIITDWAHDNSFNQEIYLRRISDALSVYIDPHIQEYDASDAKFAFIFRDMDRRDFTREYPKHKDLVTGNPLNHGDSSGWNSQDRVRVAEYWRVVDVPDTLHHLDNGSTVKQSEVEAEDTANAKNRDPDDRSDDQPTLMDQLKINSVHTRDIMRPKVEHYLLAGDEIIEGPNAWAGKYIPICRVVGTETVIDNQMDRRGHVRALIDSQRAYNWHSSAGIEFVALQAKTPWVAPVLAIEGYETDWSQSNTVNLAVLPYNHMDDNGQPIPPPTRLEPPSYAGAYLEGMKVATSEMELCSGQPDAQMGLATNERSGKAIQERQRGGATQTYHFVDHLSSAIRFAGKILIDLIPKIYDTPRILKILSPNGTQSTIKIDPNAQQAHQPSPPHDDEGFSPEQVSAIFNPCLGDYDVVADNGPNYATRRQEAFNALSQIITQNEAMAPLLGDLWARSADFPLSDEIADRLLNMVPKQALGQADPQVEQLQQQLAAQHGVMQQLSDELKQAKNKQATTDLQKDIDVYDSETRRLAAVGKIDEAALKPIVRELVSQILGTPVNQVIHQHMLEQAAMESNAAQIPGSAQNTAAQAAQPQPQQPPQQG